MHKMKIPQVFTLIRFVGDPKYSVYKEKSDYLF